MSVEHGSEIDITIGVASLDEEKTIGLSLTAILTEMATLNVELLVVAGGNDRTIEVARDATAEDTRVTLIEDSSPRGKPAAINKMLAMAKGALIVLSDGDAIVNQGSISKLVSAFSEDGIGCACVRVVGRRGDYNLVEKVCDWTAETMTLVRESEYRNNRSVSLAPGNLLAFRKHLIQSIPEDTNSDDGYISASVRGQGYRIAFVSDATVEIKFADTLSDYVKQKTRTRLGHIQVAEAFPNTPTRTVGGEFLEFVRLSRKPRPRQYGPVVSLAAIFLNAMTWALAHTRHRLPWLFKAKAWQPIESTKGM